MIDMEKDDLITAVSSWQYDEMIHIGEDFANREVVEAYDASHRRFRNVEKENETIIKGLCVQKNHILADFGSGTGAFVLQAARQCAKVYAIDISKAMQDYTRWKAQSQGLTNIECCHGGFLTYVHSGDPLDAIITSMALHHLPDFWKHKALSRLNGMLKDGGRLFLADVVFSDNEYEKNIQAWMTRLTEAGSDMAGNVSRHVSKEHSTFTWIMEGLLVRSGFEIDRAEYSEGVLAKYFCTKI
jgi:ubiquinone/menaquinone biosynthesis C-methylase UbiE